LQIRTRGGEKTCALFAHEVTNFLRRKRKQRASEMSDR
jgi:hypothetical protein